MTFRQRICRYPKLVQGVGEFQRTIAEKKNSVVLLKSVNW